MVISSIANLAEKQKFRLKKVSAKDIAEIVGCSQITVLRALNFPDKVFHDTRLQILDACRILGYKKEDQYKNIKPELIIGKDKYGTPKLNTQILADLSEKGKSLKEISNITGVNVLRLKKEFRLIGLLDAKIQFKPYAYIKSQMHVRGSELRKKLFLIIKRYKNGVPIERACKELGFSARQVTHLLRKSTAYVVLKKRKLEIQKHLVSKKYPRESDMTNNAENYIKNLGIKIIEKEKTVYSTGSGHGKGGYVCDFYAPEINTVYELKQRTVSNSNKCLFGQILVYKTCGHNVSVLFPDDVIVTKSLQHVLDAHKVTVHRLP